MEIKVNVPVRVVVDAETSTSHLDHVDEALGAAARRALLKAKAVLEKNHGELTGCQVRDPVVSWSGPGLHAMSAEARRGVEALIHRVLTTAGKDTIPQASGQVAHLAADGAGGSASTPAPTTSADDAAQEAFEIDDDLRSYPGIDEILRSPHMLRYFGLRDSYHRLYPHRRLPAFARLRPDQLPTMMRAYGQLQQLSELDWTLLERLIGAEGLPGDWDQAADQVDRFARSADRALATRDAAARDVAIDVAHAHVVPAREARALSRLTGLEELYQLIKLFEMLPSGAGAKEFRFDFEQRKRVVGEELTRKLRAANFAGIGEFDDAVRDLRRVVRDRAVDIALATMKQSERVLQAELRRYREPRVLNSLATELAAILRSPIPSEDAVLRLLGAYPILRDAVAMRGALQVRVPDLLGDVLRQNAQAQLDNIGRSRAALAHDTENVFGLNRVIDETLEQLGLPPESVQAAVIKDGRAAPGHPVRAAVEALLLVLSFAWGPLAAVGYVAQAISLVMQIHALGERGADEERRRVAAHAGTPLADAPVPSGQGWELFALFTSLIGLIPGAPKSLLSGETRLSAKAGELLASEGRPYGFLPGTHFAEAGPGQVAIWHPDFPDEVFRLDARGLTRFSKAGGAVRQTGHWPLSTMDASSPAAAASALVRPGAPAPRAAAQATVPPLRALPPGTTRPGLGSLGAMSRLSLETQAAEARLRGLIETLIERTEETGRQFATNFIGGGQTAAVRALVAQAEALVNRLRSYETRLTVGLSGYRRGLTEPAMDEAVREAIDWAEPKLYAAEIQVRNLERLVRPVPWPTVAEQAVIDQYVERLALLRDLQVRVQAGETAALALRNGVRDELIGLEQRAAHHAPGEESLLSHLLGLARDRRRLLRNDGQYAAVAGVRGTVEATTVFPGGLGGRTIDEVIARLGRPKVGLGRGARRAHAPSEPVTSAVTLTWVFADRSHIRLDVPGPGVRPFESAAQPHFARVGEDGVHYSDHGISVPADSAPAHIPLRITPRLQVEIDAARNAPGR